MGIETRVAYSSKLNIQEQASLIALGRRLHADGIGSHDVLDSDVESENFVFRRAREIDNLIKQRANEPSRRLVEKKVKGPQILQYDGNFDWNEYEQAYAIKNPEERNKKINELDNYIRRQLITHLGERLHVLLSTTEYRVSSTGDLLTKEGVSLLEMVKNGRDHLKKPELANPIDFPRQDAEVDEIEKIIKTLCNTDAQIGTTMLAISPTGKRDLSLPEGQQDSFYLHNFYDIFTLKEREFDGNKQRFVEVKRYSSALSYEEYVQKMIDLKRGYFEHITDEDIDLDTYFLSHPEVIENKTPDNIHSFLHHDHEYLLEEDFNTIAAACSLDIERYIQVMHSRADRNLSSEELKTFNKDKKINQASAFNLILINADKIKDAILDKKKENRNLTYEYRQKVVDEYNIAAAAMSMAQVRDLGRIGNVRQAAGDCPGKSGMDTGGASSGLSLGLNTSSFSLRDGINSSKKESSSCSCGSNTDNHYHCPSCDKKFADETSRKESDRTKQCACGQKFGC